MELYCCLYIMAFILGFCLGYGITWLEEYHKYIYVGVMVLLFLLLIRLIVLARQSTPTLPSISIVLAILGGVISIAGYETGKWACNRQIKRKGD